MARKREGFSIEDLVQISKAGGKRFVRYDEGKMLYSMGRNRFIELAKNANARYKVNGVTLCDTQVILSIMVGIFISKIFVPMLPYPKYRSIAYA